MAQNVINSTISTPGARFMVIDMKNLDLNTPLRRYEHMVIKISSLLQEVIDEYNLLDLVHDGRVYIEIQKCIYGLLHAGILPHKLLQEQLSLDGY
jgi:hypothetical protein